MIRQLDIQHRALRLLALIGLGALLSPVNAGAQEGGDTSVEQEVTSPTDVVLPSNEAAVDSSDLPEAPAPWAATGGDVSAAQWQEEYRALNELIQRFNTQVGEFERDVEVAIDDKYNEELGRYQQQYDAQLRKLQDEVTVRRKEAIARYEQFLQRYPDSKHSAIAMVRLAELYYEEAQIDFLFADREYELQWEAYREGKRSSPPPDEEPFQDFTRSLALYDQVLTRFPAYKDVDGVFYMKGFILGKEDAVNHDAEGSKDAFLALIEEHPESDYAFQAFLLVGDYYFDQNELEESIRYYSEAMGYKDKAWDRALYKLAWAQYKLGEWESAIARFVELLDYSEDLREKEDKESDLRPEGVQYLAISLADSGTFDDAVAHFEAIGGRPYQLEILTQLADVYVQLARYDDAVDAYKKLQGLYPDNPQNPEFQAEIVKIYLGLPGGPELESALAAKMQLVEGYNGESGWAEAMNADLNKRALTHAQELVRDSLKDIAYQYHSFAVSPDTPDENRKQHYDTASRYYREYLSRFPYSEDAYELQYYFADCLYNSGDMEGAALEFKRALTYTAPQYHAQAARGVVDSYANLIQEAGMVEGVVEPFPADPAAKGIPQPIERKPLLQQYIEAIDTYAKIDKESDDVVAKLMLIAARIAYFHNDFEEARLRFDELIAQYPKDESSVLAAQFYLDSYRKEQNYLMQEEASRRFMAMNLGQGTGEAAQLQDQLKEFLHTAVFKEAIGYLDPDETNLEKAAANNSKAAEAFIKYADEFPDTEYTASALANAAIAFEAAGDTDRAIEVNKRLIAEHPDAEYVESAYYSIASNYEKAFDFAQAIKYHEALARNFQGSPSAPVSLYNASYLRLGSKQYSEAAAGFERYVRLYSDRDDAEAVLFLAAETYDKAGNWREAIRVYRDYVRRYPRVNGDHVMFAHKRIIEGLDALGRGREALDVERKMDTEFAALKEAELMTLRGLNLYAEVEFREVVRQFEAFRDVRLYGSERQLLKQFDRKQEALAELVTTVGELTKLGDPEFRLAGLYKLGEAYQTMASQAAEQPCPGGLDEFECEMYMEQLREVFVYPQEEQAIAIYERILANSKEAGLSNEWVDSAWDRLSELQPDYYPIRKPERFEMVPADRDFSMPPVTAQPLDSTSARR